MHTSRAEAPFFHDPRHPCTMFYSSSMTYRGRSVAPVASWVEKSFPMKKTGSYRIFSYELVLRHYIRGSNHQFETCSFRSPYKWHGALDFVFLRRFPVSIETYRFFIETLLLMRWYCPGLLSEACLDQVVILCVSHLITFGIERIATNSRLYKH